MTDRQTQIQLTAFPPIVGPDSRLLILGTMPGVKSLTAGQYYAHPQNKFWKIMGEICGFTVTAPYDERVEILKAKKIAVWDVLQSCAREGSLDSNIKDGVMNDFDSFFRKHPSIRTVIFDSGTAETLYRRHVLPTLSANLAYDRVPSPSPAHASLPYAAKLAAWERVLKAPRP